MPLEGGGGGGLDGLKAALPGEVDGVTEGFRRLSPPLRMRTLGCGSLFREFTPPEQLPIIEQQRDEAVAATVAVHAEIAVVRGDLADRQSVGNGDERRVGEVGW